MRDNEADELETVEICTHESVECRCRCHWPGNELAVHDKACCTPCYRCGFRRANPGQDWRLEVIRQEKRY